MTESDFLAAVAATPADPSPRLAYADWLDEHADPSGTLVRVEEEMASLAPYADRYWELKPRRNELRAAAAPDWLAAMGYGTTYRPVFAHGVPDGWRERWRLAREFVERWHGVPMPDVGGHPEAIRAAEVSVGRELPPAVREWVAFGQDVRNAPSATTIVRDIFLVSTMRQHPAVSLLIQSEGDCFWNVPFADLGRPDPPVREFERQASGELVENHTRLAASTSGFALGQVFDSIHAAGGFQVGVTDTTEFGADLKAAFPVHARFDGVEYFEAANMLARVQKLPGDEVLSFDLHVARSVPLEAVPECVRKYARGGGGFYGMFSTTTPEMESLMRRSRPSP